MCVRVCMYVCMYVGKLVIRLKKCLNLSSLNFMSSIRQIHFAQVYIYIYIYIYICVRVNKIKNINSSTMRQIITLITNVWRIL